MLESLGNKPRDRKGRKIEYDLLGLEIVKNVEMALRDLLKTESPALLFCSSIRFAVLPDINPLRKKEKIASTPDHHAERDLIARRGI